VAIHPSCVLFSFVCALDERGLILSCRPEPSHDELFVFMSCANLNRVKVVKKVDSAANH
jgi:hypothetical protein